MTKPRKFTLGDSTMFIALAAENRLAAQRESEVWGVVEDLARAHALRLGPPSQAATELSIKFTEQARARFESLMTDSQYAALPHVAETSGHAYSLAVGLLEVL